MTTKTVYLFDALTGEYKGAYDSQESPLEPGVYIEPVHSTPTTPPTTSVNQVAVFSNGSWSVQPDYRGQTWYDKTSGVPTEITSIGTPSNNLANTPPVSTLVSQAQAQLDIVTGPRGQIIRCVAAGVSVPAAWTQYVQALRAIVNGTDKTSTALPAQPAYVSGT